MENSINKQDNKGQTNKELSLNQDIVDVLKNKTIVIKNDYDKQFIQDFAIGKSFTKKEETNYRRILKLVDLPDLSEIQNHPINLIVNKVISSPYFQNFDNVKIPEVVSEYETFDLFDFASDHVARNISDSYFINKSENKKESLLLRPHTSVMWYYYLLNGGGIDKLENTGEVSALSWGKVYRVDDLDKTHHECFHQIDGLKITDKEQEVMTKETIESVLVQLIKAIFGENIQYRINPENYPYTYNSLEIEVMYNGKRLEVVGAGIVNPVVLENLGLDPEKYNGWAFGFGIERLAMVMKNIPDIRLFWSNDHRIVKQWKDLDTPYKEVSNMPATYRDISMLVPKEKFQLLEKELEGKKIMKIKVVDESSLFEIASLVRDISPDLIEEIKIIDIFDNEAKLGEGVKSVTIKIAFRAIDRTLTNEEINTIYFHIRQAITDELSYTLR